MISTDTMTKTFALLLAGALLWACGNSSSRSDDEDDGDAGADGGSDADADGDGDADGDADADPFQCESPQDAGGFSFSEIPTWRDDAQAAYSFIHDDLCDYGVRGIEQNAVPALNSHGVHAALGPYVEACDESSMWDQVAQFAADGHEIINHSYTHPEISTANADHEVAEARDVIAEEIGQSVDFYIFPYDYFTAETIAAVEDAGHLGARAGNRDDNDGFDNPPINGPEPTNDFEVEFDVWPRTYSKYALFYPTDILTVHAWNAIEAGGWAVREFHSVIEDGEPEEGNGFGPIELSDYEEHLEFLVDAWQKGIIWTANPTEVIKYRHARSACGASVANDTISYDTSDSECAGFATPISVIVTTGNDVPSVQGLQNGEPVLMRKLRPNTFSITADPTQGDVMLSGCADPGPEVQSGDITPKPSPADSVCDIETVVGTGSDGAMDDLERPFEEFQVLPNPSQADGRTGSWSWYPQNMTVEMEMEGSNTVLHAEGSNLAAWAGVSLAFLGGNGAGTCYDASAYEGLRFDIKGTVSTSDALNNIIIFSMVTAETQTQTYGGDLDGTGGHFNYQVTVTGNWQTVSVPWTSFNPPTWGDTQSLTNLALGKLQAIDWGVSDTASSFEFYLDNIELY